MIFMDLDNKVNDLMREWIIFRDECLSRITEEDKGHLIEFELREKFPAPSENESFVEQVNYLHMIQEMMAEFVMEEVKSV